MMSEIIIDHSELRGKIKAKIGNEGKFAELIGRTPQFVSSVFNNKSFWDMKDIIASCDVLEIPYTEIGFYFYTLKVSKSELE